MISNPAAWYQLRAKVQTATAQLSDAQLASRCSALQRRWRDHKRGATWAVLQEIYTEQHRRQWAA